MKIGDQFNYLHPDDGWRLVEFCAHYGSNNEGEMCVVRDVHRGEFYIADGEELIPIVPRSEWEDGIQEAAAKFLASGP